MLFVDNLDSDADPSDLVDALLDDGIASGPELPPQGILAAQPPGQALW